MVSPLESKPGLPACLDFVQFCLSKRAILAPDSHCALLHFVLCLRKNSFIGSLASKMLCIIIYSCSLLDTETTDSMSRGIGSEFILWNRKDYNKCFLKDGKTGQLFCKEFWFYFFCIFV